MRLFRRTLLCLVVGVTAFGAAGWGFRPKASWEVDLGEATKDWHFAVDERKSSVSHPLWVYLIGRRDGLFDATADGIVWAFHEDGRPIRKVVTPVGFPRIAADGSLAIEPKRSPPYAPIEQEFTLVGKSDEKLVRRKHRGLWELSEDGLHLFEIRRASNGSICEVVDLRTGETKGKLELPNHRFRIGDMEAAVSPDASLLAASDWNRLGSSSPYAIELFDTKTGKVVKRIIPPPEDSDSRSIAEYPHFLKGGQEVQFRWRGKQNSKTMRYSIADDRLEEVRETGHVGMRQQAFVHGPCATPLPEFSEQASIQLREHSNDGLRLWRAVDGDEERHKLWVSLDDTKHSIFGWRQFPHFIPVPRVHWHFTSDPGPGWQWQGDPIISIVPGRRALLAAAKRGPLIPDLPRFLEFCFSKTSKFRADHIAAFWNDWGKDEWRSVGWPGTVYEFQTRSDAVFTLANENERTVLQSWPLPPRDPKWPALGVACASAGFAWWLCARRYRRRLRAAT